MPTLSTHYRQTYYTQINNSTHKLTTTIDPRVWSIYSEHFYCFWQDNSMVYYWVKFESGRDDENW